jgi:hypothetical protein
MRALEALRSLEELLTLPTPAKPQKAARER